MKDDAEVQRPATLSEDDFRLLTTWRETLRDFLSASKRILKQVGVTTSEYQALLVIRLRTQQQSISVGQLARQLRIQSNGAVSLVNRMTRQSLVRRVPSDDDARIMHLRLTAKGETLLRKLVDAHRLELDRIKPTLRNIIA